MNINNIQLVARLERKILSRDTVFRAIAILGLAIIFFLQFSLHGKSKNQWFLVALPSSIPFVNALLFTFLQIFLVIIATSSWRRTENHFDTLESFRVRQTSNAEYLLGKSCGIITMILILNVISITLALCIHLFNSHSPLQFSLYIFYFFTLSIPSLVFLTGITMYITGQIKQQGLSILLLFFLLIGTTSFLPEIQHGLFDFRAKNLPNVFSDITGHVKLYPYLLHRFIFFFLGITGIIYSIGIEKRLPNNVKTPFRGRLLGTGSMVLILSLGFVYYTFFQKENQIRTLYQETSLKYNHTTHPRIKEHALTFEQNRDRITVQSQLKIANLTGSPLDRIILYLNPGLNVTQLHDDTNLPVKYNREYQILEIQKPLPAGDSIVLTIKYEGKIDERICYLDICTPDYWNDQFMNCPLHFGKRYAYVSDDFTLLTPECYWYPVTIPIVNLAHPYLSAKDFTIFHLKVVSRENQLVISQGECYPSGDSILFHNKQEQQGISLCMGHYEKRSMYIDSLLVELNVFKNHFFLEDFFKNVTEENLRTYLRTCKERLEFRFKKPYPFNKFVLVETPVSFTINYRQWTNNTAFVQPEIVFFPERWVTQQSLFSQRNWDDLKTQQATGAKLGNSRTLEEIYLTDLFILSAFMNSTRFTPNNIFIPSILQIDKKTISINNPQAISPMFLDFSNYWYSEKYPAINKIMYLLEIIQEVQHWNTNNRIAYETIRYLSSHSFKDAIDDTNLDEQVRLQIFLFKTIQLLYSINLKISAQEFHQFIDDYKTKNAFRILSFDSFLEEIKKHLDIDLASILPNWYNSTGLPSFKIRDFTVLELNGEDFPKYQMRFKIYNNSDIDGIITTASLSSSRFYFIPAGTSWEIIHSRDNNTCDLSLNLGYTLNIPSRYHHQPITVNLPFQEKREGIYPCDPKDFLSSPDEIIVDNEDRGFKYESLSTKKWLKRTRNPKTPKEYIFESFSTYSHGTNTLPTNWTFYVCDEFYGETIRSALCKLADKGDQQVSWTAELPKSGKYEIFIYEPPFQIRLDKIELEQHYILSTQEGEEQVIVKKRWDSEGWLSLGKFYFKAGENKIILTDKGSHPEQVIIADAVKWKLIK